MERHINLTLPIGISNDINAFSSNQMHKRVTIPTVTLTIPNACTDTLWAMLRTILPYLNLGFKMRVPLTDAMKFACACVITACSTP